MDVATDVQGVVDLALAEQAGWDSAALELAGHVFRRRALSRPRQAIDEDESGVEHLASLEWYRIPDGLREDRRDDCDVPRIDMARPRVAERAAELAASPDHARGREQVLLEQVGLQRDRLGASTTRSEGVPMAMTTATPAVPEGAGRWSRQQADALLRAVEDMFHRRDIDALVHGFTEDCVFRFAEQPEQRGRGALRSFFAARFSRQKNYRLRKTLLALDGNILANLWEGTWEDATTGKAMAGRGVEAWTMRDGMIAVWDAAFNVWEEGGERRSPIM
jgi:nuclear transport factor 2 (NTF2) superfamily protein